MELALPNLHPAVVHFPIVVLLLAFGIEVVGLLRRSPGSERLAAGAWLLGAVCATAALLTGQAAATSLGGVPLSTQPVISDHADWANWTVAGAWVVALLRLAGLIGEEQLTRVSRLTALGLGGTLQVLVAMTADNGGALVYQHALAVQIPESALCPVCPEPAPEADAEPPPETLSLRDDGGTVTWEPRAGDAGILGETDWPERGIAVPVDGAVTLLLPVTLDDVRVNAWLDLSGLSGEAQLLHHFHEGGGQDGDEQEGEGGAFALSSAGQARLLDLTPDAEVLDQKSHPEWGRLALSISAAGQRLEGLVGGEMLVHGRAPPRSAGAVGLRFTGTGVAVIERLEAIRLDGGHFEENAPAQ